MKQILIIGGTRFIGRHLVAQLSAQKDVELTLFNRGISNPNAFPSLKKIVGDRNVAADLNPIFETQWDCVVDLSCYFPQSLSWILKRLHKNLGKYIFISTCSVYDNERHKGMLRGETAPLLSCSPQEAIDESTGSYGQRKAACEALLKAANLPYVIFRPALVYGAYDPTDRFYYWLHQAKKSTQVLVPENGQRKFSMTYVEDLVQAIVSSIRNDKKDVIYNCTSQPVISIAQLLDTALSIDRREVEKINTDAAFLKEQNVAEWMDIPLWIHSDDFTFSNQKICSDLNFTPLDFEKSLKRTHQYFETLGYPKPNYGIGEAEQKRLINLFIARHKA